MQTCRGSATKRSLAPMAAQERSSKSGGSVEFLPFHFGLAFEYLPGKTLTESNWPTFSEYTASALAALSYFSARFTISVAFNSIYYLEWMFSCFFSRETLRPLRIIVEENYFWRNVEIFTIILSRYFILYIACHLLHIYVIINYLFLISNLISNTSKFPDKIIFIVKIRCIEF